uniref:Uncharacterized protein n=1 Tax=Pseudictyota dubia TaxID=2749911 RepID=A0A7R9WGD3_9STRA
MLLGQKPQVQQQQSRNTLTAAKLSTAMPPLVKAEEQGVLSTTETFQAGRNVAGGNATLPPKLSLGTTRSGSELKTSVPNVDVDDLLNQALQHYRKDKDVFGTNDAPLTNKHHSHKSTMKNQLQPRPQPQGILSKTSKGTLASSYFAQEAA